MRPLHYFIVGLVVLTGIGVAAAILPRESELALIYFKDKNFAEARSAYEKRLAEGDLSPSLVTTLSQLYLQYGQVTEAIALMEKYLQENPNDSEARGRLGRLYQYGQRPYDYQINLESLVEKNPTEATLRELNDIYSFAAQFDRQIETLRKLVDLFPGNAEDYLNLAALQAGRGLFAEASLTIEQFHDKFPERMTADVMQLWISLLLDAGEVQEAVQQAGQWLKQRPSLDAAATFASTFSFKGQPVAALNLILPLENQAEQSPTLLSVLIQLHAETGNQARALERLERLFGAQNLPAQLHEQFIDLLLQKQDIARAIEVASSLNLAGLPDWLLSNLADAALADSHLAFAEDMVDRLGENFLNDFPLLGAHLALARGDQLSFQKWMNTAERTDLTQPQKITLANLYARGGRRAEAIKMLETLANSPDTPDSAVIDLANLYLENNAASEGAALLSALRSKRPTLDVSSAWVRLAAAAGQEAEAVRWVKSTAHSASTQTLKDLFFIASDQKLNDLAIIAAQRLHLRSSGRENKKLLTQALVNGGKEADALPYLRELMSGKPDQDIESLYVSVLTAERGSDPRAAEDLRKYWTKKLEGTGMDVNRREEVVFALLDLNSYDAALPTLRELARQKSAEWLGAYADAAAKAGRRKELTEFLIGELKRPELTLEAKQPHVYALLDNGGETEALPYLKDFADSAGGNWIPLYEDALAKANRSADLLDFRRSRSTSPSVPVAERFEIAGRILASGNKSDAERIFLELAATAGPASPEIGQLLFLWGPRPQPYALEWLEARARNAKGGDAETWLEHLLNANAPARAAAVAAELVRQQDGGSGLVNIQIRAQAAAQDTAGFSLLVRRELEREENPETLRRYGRLAMEIGELETALSVFARMLESAPYDQEALRRHGSLSFVVGNYTESRQSLTRYFESNARDYESDFIYGELMVRQTDLVSARLHYERAFQEIERTTRRPYAMRAIRAQLLERLGRMADSVVEFEKLIQERPDDKHLRADYATVLLRAGRLDAAGLVLKAR